MKDHIAEKDTKNLVADATVDTVREGAVTMHEEAIKASPDAPKVIKVIGKAFGVADIGIETAIRHKENKEKYGEDAAKVTFAQTLASTSASALGGAGGIGMGTLLAAGSWVVALPGMAGAVGAGVAYDHLKIGDKTLNEHLGEFVANTDFAAEMEKDYREANCQDQGLLTPIQVNLKNTNASCPVQESVPQESAPADCKDGNCQKVDPNSLGSQQYIAAVEAGTSNLIKTLSQPSPQNTTSLSSSASQQCSKPDQSCIQERSNCFTEREISYIASCTAFNGGRHKACKVMIDYYSAVTSSYSCTADKGLIEKAIQLKGSGLNFFRNLENSNREGVKNCDRGDNSCNKLNSKPNCELDRGFLERNIVALRAAYLNNGIREGSNNCDRGDNSCNESSYTSICGMDKDFLKSHLNSFAISSNHSNHSGGGRDCNRGDNSCNQSQKSCAVDKGFLESRARELGIGGGASDHSRSSGSSGGYRGGGTVRDSNGNAVRDSRGNAVRGGWGHGE